MALEGMAGDLVMLAMAVAVAAVILAIILVGLYIWALRRAREEAERRGGTGVDLDGGARQGEGLGNPPPPR
jgi:uncharacterized iron-regulated membrane protein